MRIVLATNSFNEVGGSETYLLTVAEQLLRLGHGVTIYALDLGKMADLARGRGIDIAAKEVDLGPQCDVVIAQDGGVAYELADRWPRTSQIFVCHSTLFDLQLPPLVPGIVGAVIVLSDRVKRRIQALDTPHRIVRLRQPIDTERLVPRGPPRGRPRRALLLGNYLRGEARRILVDAWGAAGVEVVQVGSPTTPSLHPEQNIAEADIVVGKGRAILDAMSCGRAAYVYDMFGTDGWVTQQVYRKMEADAFAGQALPRVVDVDQLRRDLVDYSPLMAQVNRELVMNYHQARTHADQLIALCGKLAPASSPSTTPRRELARLVRLKWHKEAELFALRNEFASLEERVRSAEQAVIDLRRQRRVRAGLALGRISDWLRSLGRRSLGRMSDVLRGRGGMR